MKVIYKSPGCAPEPRDIPNTLEELQAAVGGYIETLTAQLTASEAARAELGKRLAAVQQELSQVKAERSWISVKDKLPETDEFVLVLASGKPKKT